MAAVQPEYTFHPFVMDSLGVMGAGALHLIEVLTSEVEARTISAAAADVFRKNLIQMIMIALLHGNLSVDRSFTAPYDPTNPARKHPHCTVPIRSPSSDQPHPSRNKPHGVRIMT